MEKDLDADVIKATQSSLGKYVKRPPLSDKLLRKPPFRFLHDIVTTVIKTTGLFEGLFEEEELVSENVKDRESKILFLSKIVSVLGTATGKNLTVKPSKIVAGQEADKTNELLQCIAFALDNKISSDEAVKNYKQGGKQENDTKSEKSKEIVKTVKKANDGKKLTSRSNEKLISNKRDTSEKPSTRNEKEKASTNKSKQKETVTVKKDVKTTQQTQKSLVKKNSIDKQPQNQNEKNTIKNKKSATTADSNIHIEEASKTISVNDSNDQDSGVSLEKQDLTDTDHAQQLTPRAEQEEVGKLNSSYTIENDLNSSLSSQDLMEVDHAKAEENQFILEHNSEINATTKQKNDFAFGEPILNNAKDLTVVQEDNKTQNQIGHSRPSSLTKDTSQNYNHNQNDMTPKTSKVGNYVRPKSVRPSSSRPGAPRLREKHDNIVTGNENLLVGKVNIIVENTPNEEEEDSSILIVDHQADAPSISQDQQELQLPSNQQHGALVQQILDSQKEFSQITGKTEIEWQFGAQKAREAVNQEVEQLRFNIQALSRVANPLGKVLDHIQEDVEVMRQELQQWSKTYEEASKELMKQKTANEESLLPLHTKLKQLDADIEEKRDKINDLKIIIHKNSSRIEKLLASGDVQ